MNQEKIGQFIADLRKENDMTQEELAEKLGVSVKSISRWENGKNMPDHSLLKDICNIFNISINELYEGQKIKKTKKIKQILIFYFLVNFTGMFVLPILGLVAPTFILCSIICPILGLIKLVAWLFGYDIPIIIFQIGSYTLNPILGFLLTLLVSVILYVVGIHAWKLLIKYIHNVSDKRKELYVDL